MYKAVIYPMVGAAFLFGAGLASAETSTSKTTTTTTTPAASTTASKPDAAKITLTEQQAKSWVDKPIYTSDGKQVGEVVSFKRGADNVVLVMQADIGGMLGMGETRVKIMPGQFKLQTDRVVLDMTQAQVEDLPKVKS